MIAELHKIEFYVYTSHSALHCTQFYGSLPVENEIGDR